MNNCPFCNGGRPMVTFDGKTWVYQDDAPAVAREIQKMNKRKQEKTADKSSAARVLKLKKQGGR